MLTTIADLLNMDEGRGFLIGRWKAVKRRAGVIVKRYSSARLKVTLQVVQTLQRSIISILLLFGKNASLEHLDSSHNKELSIHLNAEFCKNSRSKLDDIFKDHYDFRTPTFGYVDPKYLSTPMSLASDNGVTPCIFDDGNLDSVSIASSESSVASINNAVDMPDDDGNFESFPVYLNIPAPHEELAGSGSHSAQSQGLGIHMLLESSDSLDDDDGDEEYNPESDSSCLSSDSDD